MIKDVIIHDRELERLWKIRSSRLPKSHLLQELRIRPVVCENRKNAQSIAKAWRICMLQGGILFLLLVFVGIRRSVFEIRFVLHEPSASSEFSALRCRVHSAAHRN
jgi:hypothetical protein